MNITLSIATWWQALGGIEKFFWAIALLFSFMFVIQTILAFVGGGGDDDGAFGDSDEYVDGDSGIDYQFFTVKNFITFFTVFGWVGLGCLKADLPLAQVVIWSTLSGVIIVLIMFYLFSQMAKLRSSGTLQIQNALHKQAETYLRIPAIRSGYGKVHIRVQGSLRELRALTDDEEDIPTGKPVTVIGIVNESILLVTGKG
ncbi:hypothetical protein [Parapedobacter soli]|uniref:hypothetical protein n=1 Tax=Parapedobacter soli TaxID=416955 RepID=UPI0021C64A14|nr:hypothetical protein [Parapedobacter soli]